MIWCRKPYGGAPTRVFCSATNTNPELPPAYVLPRCTWADPRPVPAGFVKTTQGWSCATGFAGSAEIRCQAPDGCLEKAELIGCTPPMPCDVAPFTDLDGRHGWIEGELSFGPSESGGAVSEADVPKYAVFFADSCGMPVGKRIA